MEQGAKDKALGTTALPELNLPAQMNSLHDLRELHKRMEELSILRKEQVDRGMAKKAEGEQALTQLKEKNIMLKKKLKVSVEANQKAENSRSQRNVEKDLMQWRKKCDELKARTSSKR